MIVTAHQPNFLPGASVLSKAMASDTIIWLDEVQYSKNGWTNRNRMPDGSWLTVPIEKATDGEPINRVRIAEGACRWRFKAVATLDQHYRGGDCWLGEMAAEITRPYRLLIALNLALLRIVFDELGERTPWVFQSHLDGGHAVKAVSREPADLAPISERLAMMVEEVGGSVYLSGPSGRNYLDETPFHERGLDVAYWKHEGPNPCALELLPLSEPAITI